MKNRVFLSVAVGALLMGATVSGCYRTEVPPDPRTTEQKAEAEWFNQKARELKGNFDALTPDEKQRAINFRKGNERDARTGFGFAANSKPN